jgi:CheY-like chemotaxis protein
MTQSDRKNEKPSTTLPGKVQKIIKAAEHALGHTQPIRILSASIDPGLNQSRALLLRHYGFDVTTSESKEHAREQIERSHFDVLIFGNTLPRDTCWELAKLFRQHNSKGKIIEIIPSPWAAPKNQPDFSVVGTAEPEQLVSTIRQTLP